MKSRILFVRTDKIGDVSITLPIDQLVAFQDCEKFWIIQNSTEFILKNSNPQRNYFLIDHKKPWKSFWSLFTQLKSSSWDEVYFFYGPWWLSLLFWILRIPKRVGRQSQWYSFLFFNSSVRQKRHLSEKHEFEYNLDLVTHLHPEFKNERSPILNLTAPSRRNLFERFHLNPQSYFVIHPGMAGSALNWPIENYIECILKASQIKQVIITGTAGDAQYLNPLKANPGIQSNQKVQFLDGKLNSEEFLFILKNAACVLAPSTGTLHLAASLGVKALGIYSPVLAQKATRWGPRGNHVKTLTPVINCPGVFSCLKEKCQHYNCLKNISVQEILVGLQ